MRMGISNWCPTNGLHSNIVQSNRIWWNFYDEVQTIPIEVLLEMPTNMKQKYRSIFWPVGKVLGNNSSPVAISGAQRLKDELFPHETL